MTERNDMIVKMYINTDDVREEFHQLEQELDDAEIYIQLTAPTVVKTLVGRMYDQWFATNKLNWDAFYIGTALEADTELYDLEPNQQVALYFVFPEELKAQGLMFKLANGGTHD